MSNVKITDKQKVTTMADSDYVFGNFGGKVGQMSIPDFRSHLNDDDNQVLNNIAFYIDVNKPSSLGSSRVDVGGNLHMRALWEASAVSVIMDANGNACKLKRNDNRFTEDGVSLLNNDGTVISTYAKCDFMKIVPITYGRVQTVTVGATSVQRLWLSLVPLPGGYIIPQLVVGKFKCSIVDGKLRSLPGMVTADSRTIRVFWELAQARSKNHGLANMDFQNYLLFHMMSKYAWRDSQNCKGSDNTLIWGVGLDGTENNGGWNGQNGIKTGATLSLGDYDGNIAVTDSNSNTCHKVNVAGFEDPWGQKWEMRGGLCSVGLDVYCWRSNIVPSGTPTADTFANIEHVVLQRATSEGVTLMNIIASEQGQGCYMIPKASAEGISYGDYYWYHSAGQLWLFGGHSDFGASCGLASASSDCAWSYSYADLSARLAYYGEVNFVSAQRLAELVA